MALVLAGLANPAMRRAQLCSLVTWTAEGAFVTALAVYAFGRGGAAEVGVVGFLRFLPAAVVLPLFAAVADRVPRQLVLLLSCAIRAAALVWVAVGAALDASAWVVYAGVLVASVVFVAFRPTHTALLPSLCSTPAELTSSNAMRTFGDGVAALLGPTLAGLALAVADTGAAFGVAAVCSLVGVVVLVGLDVERVADEERPAARPLAELVEGWRSLLTNRDGRVIAAVGAAQCTVRGALNVLVVLVVVDLLDLGDGGVGLLWAAFGAGALLGAVGSFRLAGSERLGAVFGLGVFAWGVPLALVALTSSWQVAVVLLAVVGVGNALEDMSGFTLLSRLFDDRVLTRVLGAAELLFTVAVALGSLLAPALVDLLGTRSTLAVVGVALAVVVGLSVPALRRLDRDVAEQTHEILLLQQVPMLRLLPVAAIEHLASVAVERRCASGEVVCAEGEPGDTYFVIADGRAQVSSDGRRTHELGPGDGFGEIDLLRHRPRTATVLATTDLWLRVLDAPAFVRAVCGFRPSASLAIAEVRRASGSPE